MNAATKTATSEALKNVLQLIFPPPSAFPDDTSSVSVMDFFRKTHHVPDINLFSIIQYHCSAHPPEYLVLVRHDHLEIQIGGTVKHRNKVHLKPPVR